MQIYNSGWGGGRVSHKKFFYEILFETISSFMANVMLILKICIPRVLDLYHSYLTPT